MFSKITRIEKNTISSHTCFGNKSCNIIIPKIEEVKPRILLCYNYYIFLNKLYKRQVGHWVKRIVSRYRHYSRRYAPLFYMTERARMLNANEYWSKVMRLCWDIPSYYTFSIHNNETYLRYWLSNKYLILSYSKLLIKHHKQNKNKVYRFKKYQVLVTF